MGLTNPKSPSNVGSVLRAAGCFGAGAIYYTGNRFDIAKKFSTDTQNVCESIVLERVGDLFDVLSEETKVVSVDLVEGAIPLPSFEHPTNAYYLFGPEDGSLSQDVIDKSDYVVYIPSNGSLNLAAAANVVMYDRVAKQQNHRTDNELIQNSRDRNNNTRVKKE